MRFACVLGVCLLPALAAAQPVQPVQILHRFTAAPWWPTGGLVQVPDGSFYGVTVDATGEINGQAFQTPREYRALLASRRDEFRRSLVQKMLSYALGRTIQAYDRPAVDAICTAVEADGDRFSSIITQIVMSYPFQHARGSGGQLASDMPALSSLMGDGAANGVAE